MAWIAAPFLFPLNDAQKYYKGHGVSLAAITVSGSIFAFMGWYYGRIKQGRREGREDWKLEGKSEGEVEEIGDRSPRYTYTT
jgi:hypothetical protein